MENLWSVHDFLSQYSSHSTHKIYYSALKGYFILLYPELKKLNKDKLQKQIDTKSIEYVQQDRDHRKDLIQYKQHISSQAPKTITTKLAAILRYLEDNQIEFNRNFTRNLYGNGSKEAISREHIPDNHDISKIIEFMPIQAKTLTLVLSSSGMRVGEALKIKIDDLDLETIPTTIRLRTAYTKTKKKRIVFISTEATQLLEEWLRYRPEFLEYKKSKSPHQVNEDDDRVFPFTVDNYRSIWTRAVKKADLREVDKVTGRQTLRPHNLRKFFRTHGRWENPDVAEALMGHASGLKAIYARFDQAVDILREGYLAAEVNLSILGSSSKIIELKEKVQEKEEDIDELVKNLSVMRVRLENKIGEHEVIVEELKQTNTMLLETIMSQGSRMDELEKEVQSLSEKKYAEYWDEYIERIPEIRTLSQ